MLLCKLHVQFYQPFFFLTGCTDGLVLSHLPDGPTAHFRMSSVRLRKEIKVRLKKKYEKWIICSLMINISSLLQLSNLHFDMIQLVKVFI